MADNPHQATLQPYLELHQADLADLHRQADLLREMLGREPSDDEPKPPPLRSVLESDLADIERSISKHEQAIDLASDDRAAKMLQAIADDLELAREVAADPRAFAARHGFDVPDTIDINLAVAGRDVSARIRNVDSDMPFEITWTQDGFQAPPESAPSADGDGGEPV